MTTREQKFPEERKFDLRMLERRLSKGELDAKEYEAFLKKLPNDETNAEYIDVCEETSEDEPTPHADDLTFTSA